jgi:hypothetical protein
LKLRIPKELLKRIQKVKNKRARIVLDHIVDKGFITTEELRTKYGYDHPPRAARDVREHGILLETFATKSKEGRRIAGYRLATGRGSKKGGRRAIPKKVKDALVREHGKRCAICNAWFDPTYLQADHRIPYEVGGEPAAIDLNSFMVLCRSCNRTKSWTCEHCPNWLTKDVNTCKTCYWANPTDYQHVATIQIRRADVSWRGEEVPIYDRLRRASLKAGQSVPEVIKQAIARLLK